MTTRRTFLSLFAMVGASGLFSTSAHAQRRRFRSPCLPTRTDRSPTGKDVSTKNPEFVHPDYRKWEQVTIGMHQNDVLALIGDPLFRQDRDPRFLDTLGDTTSETYSKFCYSWNFGHLEFAQPAMPLASFDFSLGIHYHTHAVRHIWQPFVVASCAGRFSSALMEQASTKSIVTRSRAKKSVHSRRTLLASADPFSRPKKPPIDEYRDACPAEASGGRGLAAGRRKVKSKRS